MVLGQQVQLGAKRRGFREHPDVHELRAWTTTQHPRGNGRWLSPEQPSVFCAVAKGQ